MITPEVIQLVETCGACPEQYDAFIGDLRHTTVGYLRLRHGQFTVDCPNPSGETVFVAHPEGDGVFQEEERERYLLDAKLAICDWYNTREAEIEILDND